MKGNNHKSILEPEPTATRTCSQCENITPGQTCLLVVWGKLEGDVRPKPNKQRQCLGYSPLPEVFDDRDGTTLWPHLEVVRDVAVLGNVAMAAVSFVAEELARGPKSAFQVIQAAQLAGLNSRAVQRASITLRVHKTHLGFQGVWLWALPKATSSSNEFRLSANFFRR